MTNVQWVDLVVPPQPVQAPVKTYYCSISKCMKSYDNKYALNRHIRNIHGSHAIPHTCHICQAVLKNKNTLQNHISRHMSKK
jgi:uncharacterized Zn-finger protein